MAPVPAGRWNTAQQAKVPAGAWSDYDWKSDRIKRHRKEIREAYGFRANTEEDQECVAEWLAAELRPARDRLAAAVARCPDMRPIGGPCRRCSGPTSIRTAGSSWTWVDVSTWTWTCPVPPLDHTETMPDRGNPPTHPVRQRLLNTKLRRRPSFGLADRLHQQHRSGLRHHTMMTVALGTHGVVSAGVQGCGVWLFVWTVFVPQLARRRRASADVEPGSAWYTHRNCSWSSGRCIVS